MLYIYNSVRHNLGFFLQEILQKFDQNCCLHIHKYYQI